MNSTPLMSYQKLFAELPQVPCSKNLEQSLVMAIRMRQRKAAKIHLSFLGIIGAASCAGIVYAVEFTTRSFSESGFYQYLSLLFSGDVSFFVYWKELGFSIVESLPMFTIAALLAATAIFLWSLVGATRDADILRSTGRHRLAKNSLGLA